MSDVKPDFGGWVTKFNVKCSDGRTILPNAFEHADGKRVPLVWRHMHNAPDNVLGHVNLENRDEGIYGHGFFNGTKAGQLAKQLVQHEDIEALSIYANNLIEKAKKVAHGMIREVSLVVSGANPGALIDFVSLQHEDGTEVVLEDEAIIYTDTYGVDISEDFVVEHEDGDETVGDVFDTLDEKQKQAVYAIIGELVGASEVEQEDSDDKTLTHEDDDEDDEEGDQVMKHNVFDKDSAPNINLNKAVLSHDDFTAIMDTARNNGMRLSKAFMAHEAGQEFLAHEGTYGIGLPDHANTELLFPDARNVTATPSWISRPMEWVSGVINGTKHVPFSRLKSLHADITPDEARARGYVRGNLKVEEVFAILRRITLPHTIYKKQKLDRDDIIDITDFDVVRWLKQEMRVMLDEEIARAILVSDGRDPVVDVDDHIPTANVRPIYGDDAVYVHNVQVALGRTDVDMIDDIVGAMDEYRGSGSPTLYCEPAQLTAWRLLKDADGRRLYRSDAELAADLRVKNIETVPVFSGVENAAETHSLRAVIVNLRDYTVGADKGGKINFFDDFDIDYNQEKYLMETRMSGALVVPKSAITLEESKT